MLPKARHEKLTIRDLPAETLVYDHERNKAHCLNRTVALIWRHCDGQTTVTALARILPQTLPLPAAEAVVQLALEQLGRRSLLVQSVEPVAGPARLSRREVLKQLVVAAVALPLVMTITASRARAGPSQTDCSVKFNDGKDCGIIPGSVCCGGACLPSFNDSNNCGACGRTCFAAVCDLGLCQPIAGTKCTAPNCNSVADCPACPGGAIITCTGGGPGKCGICGCI